MNNFTYRIDEDFKFEDDDKMQEMLYEFYDEFKDIYSLVLEIVKKKPGVPANIMLDVMNGRGVLTVPMDSNKKYPRTDDFLNEVKAIIQDQADLHK